MRKEVEDFFCGLLMCFNEQFPERKESYDRFLKYSGISCLNDVEEDIKEYSNLIFDLNVLVKIVKEEFKDV